MYQSKQKQIRRTKSESTTVRTNSKEIDWPVSALLQRIFANRNVSDPAQTLYPLANLHQPDSFKDSTKATKLLVNAVKGDKSITILGDYDTDGATASALAIDGLIAMGVGNVDYLVPNRFEYGYGLSPEIAEVALSRSPDLVITVDNGISSIDGVSKLKENGVAVIITDHHLPGRELPKADAILNPNQPGCQFASKSVAGVGVMFYLLLLLRAKLKSSNWFEERGIEIPNLADYLDLVALGTVADVVALDYNNRILVAQGIARIRAGKCRPGIAALLEIGGRQCANIVSSDFGFVVAPRLNASGRLEDISTGIECLLAKDYETAQQYAQDLNDINLERRELEQRMQTRAIEIVREISAAGKDKKSSKLQSTQGYCLYDAEWHQGVTGLVASRIKDKTDQPVVAFADSGEGLLSGSARSVDGLHIKDLFESIATELPDVLIKFGGHAMAAGLTIKLENYPLFESAFHSRVVEHFVNTSADNVIYTDGELSQDEITLGIANEIRNAAPWGQGFSQPLFDGEFTVSDLKVVGQQHLKMKLQPLKSPHYFEAIAFRAVEPDEVPPKLDRIHAVYQLDVNEFRGRRTLQIIIQYMHPIDLVG